MLECKILKIVADIFLIIVIIAMIIYLITSIKNGDIEGEWALLILFISFILWADMKIIPIMCEKMIETADNTKYSIEQNSKQIELLNKQIELLNKKTTRTTTKKTTKKE